MTTVAAPLFALGILLGGYGVVASVSERRFGVSALVSAGVLFCVAVVLTVRQPRLVAVAPRSEELRVNRPGTDGEVGTLTMRRIVPENGYPNPGERTMFIEANLLMPGETPKRRFYTADLTDADIARLHPGTQSVCEVPYYDTIVRVFVEPTRSVELAQVDRREPDVD